MGARHAACRLGGRGEGWGCTVSAIVGKGWLFLGLGAVVMVLVVSACGAENPEPPAVAPEPEAPAVEKPMTADPVSSEESGEGSDSGSASSTASETGEAAPAPSPDTTPAEPPAETEAAVSQEDTQPSGVESQEAPSEAPAREEDTSRPKAAILSGVTLDGVPISTADFLGTPFVVKVYAEH